MHCGSTFTGGSHATAARNPSSAKPRTGQHARELQHSGSVVRLPIGLDEKVCKASIEALNQILADTITLRDLYKKTANGQVTGQTFYQLHLLFDKQFHQEQAVLVDLLAERIQLLGGVSLAMAADIAEETSIPRPPRGREEVPVQISRLLEAHETILPVPQKGSGRRRLVGDDETNDVLVSDVVRTNEAGGILPGGASGGDAPVVEAD